MQTPDTIRKALRQVKDPELNLNIMDIGLVYDVAVSDAAARAVPATGCFVAAAPPAPAVDSTC